MDFFYFCGLHILAYWKSVQYNEEEGRFFMKKLWKSYKVTILLVLALIIGAICGIIFKEDVNVVKPLGDLFLNLLFK